jgi:hypothetical protein
MVRERSPYKDEVDISDLSYSDFLEYATVCGKVVAQTHARSDQDGGLEADNIEDQIMNSVDHGLFIKDVTRFAKVATKRILRDYKLFTKDYKMGAFRVKYLHD